MLVKAQSHIDTASNLLSTIKEANEANFKQSVGQLQTLISDLQNKLTTEKQFVKKYINTKKLFRPLLFRKIG